MLHNGVSNVKLFEQARPAETKLRVTIKNNSLKNI